MAEDNVETVLRAYEAWNRRDFDAVIAEVDPEIEWGFEAGTRFPGTDASYHGHEGVREFWRVFIEPWEEISVEVEETRDAGDAVVAFVVFHGKMREGLELDTPFTHVVWLRNGKITRFRAYDDRDAALAAAGIPGA